MLLVEVQQRGTGTTYGLEILHQSGKRVKTKSKKVLGATSFVCRSYRGKTGSGAFCPPILSRVEKDGDVFRTLSNIYDGAICY